MGGTLKSWLRRTAEAMPCDRVDRGPEDCATRLKEHFESDEWLAEHSAGSRYKINVIKIHWVADRVIKRPSHYTAEAGGIVEQVTPQNPASVAPLKGGSSNYSFWVVDDEQLAMRRFTCWCNKCMFSNGRVCRREEGAVVRVDGCENEFSATLLRLTDTASVARTRATRHAEGESMANGLKAAAIGTRFACATPPHGYDQISFELFETAAPAKGKSPVVKLAEETSIGGIKFAKNRVVVYCRALERLDDDTNGRSFALSTEIRAVEGRMIRYTGAQLEEAVPPQPSDHTGHDEVPPIPRRFVISESGLAELISECEDEPGARAPQYAQGEALARRLKATAVGTRFACATPPHGYDNISFELFETAAPTTGTSAVVKLSSATTINGIKFAKNRVVVYCRALERLDDDPNGRSFSLSNVVRAVEARMIRFVGAELEEAGPPRASDHDARERRAATGRAEPPPPRRFVVSESLLADLISKCDE